MNWKYFFASLFYLGYLVGNPTIPSVIEGNAAFSSSGNLLTVTTESDRTIINWNDFSIGENEITKFLQPDMNSATLNRVISDNMSNIYGKLQSNDQIFLINPNGILIGEKGVIDVDGLVASTLDVSNEEFLTGLDMTFSGESEASIQNLGRIEGREGSVFILSKHIINQKDIYVIYNCAELGAGSSILLKTNEKKIFINPQFSTPSGTGIYNSGNINASRIGLKADGNLYELAINHTGVINSYGCVEYNGEVFLISEGGETKLEGHGSIFTQRANGIDSSIKILGKTVTLQDNVNICSAQDTGGGSIFIGGGFKGLDPEILNADNTFIGPDVNICSDSIIRRNGGDVVVWAQDTTEYYGKISAKGGIISGNGATVEISGLSNLVFQGLVNTTAVKGETGLLILDPTDITISGAITANGTFDGGSPLNTFAAIEPAALTATLNITDLDNALQTNNVLVTTTSTAVSAGNITIGAATSLNLVTQSHTLTLQAEQDILITNAFAIQDNASGTSILNLNATRDIVLTQSLTATNLASVNITTTTGDIRIDEAITATSSDLTLNSGNDIISQGGATNILNAKNINFTAAHDILVNNEIQLTGNMASSNLSWTSVNEINIAFDATFVNWDSATLSTTAGNIVIDDTIVANNVNILTLDSAQDLINQGGTNLLNDAAGQITTINLQAARDVIITTQIDINNFKECIITAGNDVNFNEDFEPDNTTTLSVNAGHDITITALSDILPANMTTLSFIANNDYTSSRPFSATNVSNINITATTGNININLGGTTNVTGANTTLTAGQDINILDRVINDTSGNFTIVAGQDLNLGSSTNTVDSQIGTSIGNVTITTGRDLIITGGTGSDFSQIGYSKASVNSDIILNIGRDLILTAGTGADCYALIGHGNNVAGVYSGDIIINSVGGNVTLSGDTGALGSNKFAQIGFSRSLTSGAVSSFSGNIRGSSIGSPALISGTLTLNGGADTSCFALFGHGGIDSNALETYSGDVRVRANSIVLNGGTASDCHAAIGYFAVSQVAGLNPITITSGTVQAISDTNITMTANSNGLVSIGARALTSVLHFSNINLDLVDIQTAQDFTMTSGTGPETEAIIGAYTNFGVASTAINMTIGEDLLITSGTGDSARIINGAGPTTALKNTLIQVSQNIIPHVLGAQNAYIENVTGNLTVNALNTITLPALTFIRNLGGSGGFLDFSGGTILIQNGGFIENVGTGTSDFILSTSDLTLLDSSFILADGNIIGSIDNDLNLTDNCYIKSISGTLDITTGRDISIIGASTGSSYLQSALSGTYTVGRSFSLIGISGIREGYIENLAGNLEIIAGSDIKINTFARITNQGAGDLTLVTDNANPASIGTGFFSLFFNGSVGRAGGGLLRVFTAKRDLNTINGTLNINGTTFVPGTIYVDSATERWGGYYPDSFGGTPFTIFYKDAPVPPPIPNPTVFDILTLNPNAFIPFNELFYILAEGGCDSSLPWIYNLKALYLNDIVQKNPEENQGLYYPKIILCMKIPPYIIKNKNLKINNYKICNVPHIK